MSLPHVVLLCIDALRADAVVDGAPPGLPWRETGRPRTPALDAFARTARSWPVAVASSSWTKPAVPSILQSRHPCEHGVLEVAKRGGGAWSPSLPEDAPTLAERFRAGGWRTVGLAHNAQLDPTLGFDRGFDAFDADAGSGDVIADRLEALDPFRGAPPAFVYLHLIEPHWPFGGRVAEAAEPRQRGRFPFHRFRASRWKAFKQELKRGEVVPTAEEVAFLREVYALAVEEADRAVGRILSILDASGRDAIVLVTSDHGEELLDHGLVGHGQSLHEELVRVPFLLRAPGLEPGSAGTAAPPVSHVDVMPTLLAAAGLPAPEGCAGTSALAADRPDAPAFSEVKHKRRYHQSIHAGRWKLVRSYRFRRREDGERRKDYNNLAELFGGRPVRVSTRLYDLAEDPGETRDVRAERPDLAARLEADLDAWWASVRRRPDAAAGDGETRDFEEELIRRLEALGYL